MQHIYCLHSAPGSSPGLPDVPADLPQQIDGQPVRYLWKDVIRVGSYTHPKRKFHLGVDRDRIDKWVANFRRMQANGVKVTIPVDHSDRARDNLGYVVDLQRSDDTLYALCQLIGPEGAELPAKNQASLGIDPDFVDGLGNRYGEAIVHCALTPTPVAPGQGPWIAESDLSQTSAPVAASSGPATGVMVLTWAAINESDSTMNKPELEASSQAALIEAARARRDLAVARGALTPAVADRLFARLVQSPDGRVNTLALSRAAEGEQTPLALAIFADLADNRPVPPGESSGIQTLARVIPDGQNTIDNNLQERMIALASGK